MLNRIVKFFRTKKLQHKAMKELNSLSDRELRDLNISRYDIPNIVFRSLNRIPSRAF